MIRESRLLAVLVLSTTGCRPSFVQLRPDGSPGPEECPPEALKTMRFLGMQPGDATDIYLSAHQLEQKRTIILAEGPIESLTTNPLGNLYGGTRLYGRVWMGGPYVVIRYYAARPPGWDTVPICAEAGETAITRLPRVSSPSPEGGVLYPATAAVVVVETFR